LLGVQTYLAGAHGQRRIPGQSVNLAHLIWRKPCAPVPLLMYPRWFSTRGYSCCFTRRSDLGDPKMVKSACAFENLTVN
ncbi:MAG: hypothetical protein ACK5XI_01540, partial [Hyphomonadaceae bacterium]